jgi:ribulose-bisphosphate carboxylase large chain
MGPKAGAASLRQGWKAFQNGMTLEEYSQNHPELKTAIETFHMQGLK